MKNKGKQGLEILFVCLLTGLLFTGSGLQYSAKIAGVIQCPELVTEFFQIKPASAQNSYTIIYSKTGADQTDAKTQKASRKETLKKTPSDIALLMEEAKTEFANDQKDGTITEKTYTAQDGTVSFSGIAVRNKSETWQDYNFQTALDNPIDLQVDKTQPAVLLFHTHTTESYEILDRGWYAQGWSSRTRNLNKNMVRVGDAIAQSLKEHGFQVLHDTEIYDDSYTGAYARSRVSVEKYLKQYPNLLVTLDIHRDAIQFDNGTKQKPVNTINGKKAAQIMIISGVEEGKVKKFDSWQQNLSFALKLQRKAETLYPGLMRPVFFCQRKYNMDLTPCSLLLEMGSDANTLEEAVYAGRLIGDALGQMLEEYIT